MPNSTGALNYTDSLNFIRKRFAHKLEAAYSAKDGALPNSKPYAGFDSFMNILQRADPTASKRYLPWITLQYIRGHFYAHQDTGVIREALTVFHKNKHRMTVGKDISQHRSLLDLYRFIAQFEEQASIPEGLPKELHDAGEATLVHYSTDTMIIVPHTESASQQLGSGTKWCTAAREDCAFDEYNSDGPLIVVRHKGRKYQIHYETNSFMAESDTEVDDVTRLMLLKESQGIRELHQHKLDAGYNDIFRNPAQVKSRLPVCTNIRKINTSDNHKEYRNSYGELHRDNGLPAITRADGTQEWRVNGQPHRDNGLPTYVGADGTLEWCINGLRHRDNDLPAIIRAGGSREWWVNGMRHRDNDKPAYIDQDVEQEWWVNGQLHRDNDRPSRILADRSQHWWFNGKPHRDNGMPAIIRADGSREWRVNGPPHRDYGLPAIIRADGSREWWVNGEKIKEHSIVKRPKRVH